MPAPGRLATLASLATALLLQTSVASAYVISILSEETMASDPGVAVTTTANGISISDSFDLYDDAHWSIASAQQSSSGLILVDYNITDGGGTTSYFGRVNLAFEILSESGDSTPEPVTVDFWGSSFYDHEMSGGCCFSDAPELEFSAPNVGLFQHLARDTTGVFGGPLQLLTNTRYELRYRTLQYVEGVPYNLPGAFSSWEAFDAFVAQRGTSGTTYSSAVGFLDFNLQLRPTTSVPEPGTFALIAAGLAGFGFTRRRHAAKPH